MTGLVLGDRGEVVDRIDNNALQAIGATALRIDLLVQNLDLGDAGGWQTEHVRALAANPSARVTLANRLVDIAQRTHASGFHLDLEDLADDWQLLTPIVEDLAPKLHRSGLELSVDLPAGITGNVLAKIAAAADRVVIMAYDEHDQEGPPGPIASNDFVSDTLRGATEHAAAKKLVAGLAIYGYDWVGADPADPLSFVDAHTAAKDAHAIMSWDTSGNSHFTYSDDEGRHDVWLTDAGSVWNHARAAAAAGIDTVALWRLGGEDPGIWAALSGDDADALSTVPPDPRVDNVGDGPFLSLSLKPEAGRRRIHIERGRVIDEKWEVSPSPFLVRRAGVVPGKAALTFDDGPDPKFTPQILDILQREHAPASFFVIGSQAAQHPELIRRAVAEGQEIGNHSFTHPDVATIGQLRLRTELESTTRVLETITGTRPLLYRPPSLADIEPRTVAGASAFARAGELGYLVVDADIDPRDWEQLDATRLIDDTMSQASDGGVILLHDGGGNRSTTVRALPEIIARLRARGIEIVPLAELVKKRREEVMPPAPHRAGVVHLMSRVLLLMSVTGMSAMRAVLWLALLLLIGRTLFMMGAAIVSERRRSLRSTHGLLPTVSAVVPAFNEAPVIARTIDSLLQSDLPLDVIVVDDGSTDETSAIVRHRYRRDPRVRLIQQVNAGKAAALRIGFAAARTEVVVALDGDTIFATDTVRRLLEPLRDPRVGAVAGTAEVGNVENMVTRWQALEYLTQQEIERRAWDAFAAVPIVPGAVGAWRRRAVFEVGGFSSDTLAEDADLAMSLCKNGWRVVHAPAARARTEVPTRWRALIKQRVRWSFGILQALWKHRNAPLEEQAGAFGHVVWPAMILGQVLLPLLTPIAVIAVAVAALGGNLKPAFITSAALFASELLQLIVACVLARRSNGSGFRLLPSMFASRVCYRPLLLGIMIRSLLRIVDGVPLGWGKLARRNTVRAYAAAVSSAAAAAKRRAAS